MKCACGNETSECPTAKAGLRVDTLQGKLAIDQVVADGKALLLPEVVAGLVVRIYADGNLRQPECAKRLDRMPGQK